MPWQEVCPMDERMAFVSACREEPESMTELCEEFGISRKTGYKWLNRYQREGAQGLVERSRAPHRVPWAISAAQAEALLAYRKQHPRLGPKKIHHELKALSPAVQWPAPSTIGDLLRRQGLVKSRKRIRRASRSASPLSVALGPNEVYATDYKGWFRTGDGWRCEPLTMCDVFSRTELCCQAQSSINWRDTQAAMERALREYGLPRVMRCDNGPPFASRGAGGLSRLSVWWVKLGIVPEFIWPGHPEQNGQLERFHLTLKQETCSPPARDLAEQQQRFDQFSDYYNYRRPHEALGQKPPMSVYTASPRRYPSRLQDPEYSSEHEVRHVRTDGSIKWQGEMVFIGDALIGESVGLLENQQGDWQVYFGMVELGVINGETLKLQPP